MIVEVSSEVALPEVLAVCGSGTRPSGASSARCSRLDMLDTDAIHALGLLWGKAAPDVPGGWHPALLHMLDVAAVSLELLESGATPAPPPTCYPDCW